MNLLIFPAICIYFLIGYGFLRLTETDEQDEDLNSIAWFIFWPVMLIIFVISISVFVLIRFASILLRIFNKRYSNAS